MALTKEECLDALEEFSELDIKYNDHTTEYIWKESISCKGIEILHQLIKERFDNPFIDYCRAVFDDKTITTLFDTYAFADDNELSNDAIKLKSELLNILDTYKDRYNPPLKFEELKLHIPYWEDKKKSWCYFTTLNKDRETGVMVDIGSAPKMFAFNFKENSFHAREVKE